MVVNLGTNVQAANLFDAIKNSQVIIKRGYSVLYAGKYTVQQHGADGYGLCFVETKNRNAYIHVRIYGHGIVSSFEYIVTLDVNKTADNDMNDLLQELKQRFP